MIATGETPIAPVIATGETPIAPVIATGETPIAPVIATGETPIAPVTRDGRDAHRPSDRDGRDAHRPSDRDGRDAHCPDDSREVWELKQIVNGMRQELRDYLANGNGTPKSYWRRLLERTQEEMRIYERTRRELENEKNEAVWEEKNEALRRLGLRTITNHREEE